jgi:hypothetical protein
MANLPTDYNDEELTNDYVVEYCEEDNSYTQEDDNNQISTYDSNQPYYPADYGQGYDNRELIQQKIDLANNITNTVGGVLKSRERTKQLEAITKKDIAKIGEKSKNVEQYLGETFKQRDKTLDQFYKQLESDDINLKIEAMKAISNIHSSDPMQGLNKITKVYEDNDVDKLLEDF